MTDFYKQQNGVTSCAQTVHRAYTAAMQNMLTLVALGGAAICSADIVLMVKEIN